jgi:asparagine synthase (glutamine-hydrolysing)
MCGINAVINGNQNDLNKMVEVASKRGTIENTSYCHGALVNFQWLPITDKNADQQPYVYGNTTLFFNGFISNYKELAKKYEIELESNCDTELLVKFLDKFCLKRLDELNGFFAVLVHNSLGNDGNDGDGIWTSFTDRYGIKKLYEYRHEGKIFISSEIKSILNANPQIKLCKQSVLDFEISLGVLSETLFEGVKRVKKIPFVIPSKIEISYEDAKKKLKQLFEVSCKRNKLSRSTDLNDCVFLSGGIDSGIIAKFMNPKYSFSMDYLKREFSEITNIKRNSRGIHYSMICNEELFNEYIPKIVDLLVDPKVGSSYTNYALTEFASKFATVMYSGAGGDEFFGGYPHRNNKPIEQVINRTSFYDVENIDLTHFEYNLKFLEGVLNIEDTIGGFFTMETRYPLLDNDFVNFALSLPNEYLENKRILKSISGLHENLITGKKKGFSNPYINNDKWVTLILENIKLKFGS